MNTKELADALAIAVDIKPYKVRALIAALPGIVAAQVKKGDAVSFGNFGEFYATFYTSRTIKDVRTGQLRIVPARKKLVFKMARAWERTQ